LLQADVSLETEGLCSERKSGVLTEHLESVMKTTNDSIPRQFPYLLRTISNFNIIGGGFSRILKRQVTFVF
jgi:hypothetical protein